MKKVSIITPVYNVEGFVKETLISVFKQTYQNIELILIDDKGKDKSMEVINKLIPSAPSHISIKIITHKCNLGVSAARNSGIKQSSGEYLFFLDSDDLLYPDCIKELVSAISKDNSEWAICDFQSDTNISNRGGQLFIPQNILTSSEEIIHAYAKSEYNVAPWCKLVRRSFLLKNNLFFKEGIINEDAPWSFLLTIRSHQVSVVHKKLYYYRYRESSIMDQTNILKKNKAGLYTLDLMTEEINHRDNSFYNIDLYKIWMRQIVLFYSRNSVMNIKDFNSLCENINKFKISSYFLGFTKKIPFYYLLWNISFKLPTFIKSFYLKFIINLRAHVKNR